MARPSDRRRGLCVLLSFPFESHDSSSGGFQRLDLFLDALAGVFGQLDVLFLLRQQPSAAQVREVEATWGGRRSTRVRAVISCLTPRAPGPRTGFDRVFRWVAGIRDLRRQQATYAAASDPAHLNALASCVEGGPSVVFVQSLSAMFPLLAWQGRLPPVLFDINDLDHRRLYRQAMQSRAGPAERLQLAWVPAIYRGQARAMRKAHSVFVCSETDEAYVRAHYHVRRTVVVPNAVEGPNEPPADAGPPRLLFLGSMGYPPNAAAADHLISRIWPSVIARVPHAELWIGGPEPEQVNAFQRPPAGVRFLGFVPELETLYRAVRVVTCPILSGSGTRVKISEAAAHGKAIVSTSIGAEGLLFNDPREILLRDRPADFAAACVGLLTDERRALDLGKNAYDAARRLYSRPAATERISRAVERALDDPLGERP